MGVTEAIIGITSIYASPHRQLQSQCGFQIWAVVEQVGQLYDRVVVVVAVVVLVVAVAVLGLVIDAIAVPALGVEVAAVIRSPCGN